MTRLSKLRTVAKALDANPLMIGAGVAVSGLVAYSMMGSSYPPKGLSPVVKNSPAWIKTGCGDAEYIFDGTRPDGGKVVAIFPADKCPDQLPDLSKHSNVMADVLKKNPEIYHKLKNKKT